MIRLMTKPTKALCEADACGAVATTHCHAGTKGHDYCDEHAAEFKRCSTQHGVRHWTEALPQ